MVSCNASTSSNKENIDRTGKYEIIFDLGEVECPTRWEIQDSAIFILNAAERIKVLDYRLFGDSGSFTLPVFHTTVVFVFNSDRTLSGVFKNQFKKSDYQIPFIGKPYSHPVQKDAANESIYDVTMVSGDDSFKTIGVFTDHSNTITGTFLTETGDYRFLEGQQIDSSNFYLSCFDGSHLFYFSAHTDGDSISGKFYSGNHWNTSWTGVLNENVALANPDSITYLNPGVDSVDFFGLDSKGDSTYFNSSNFTKATIVQLLGTWCPNCMDESQYYAELSKKYANKIDFIGLAFERPGMKLERLALVDQYKKELDLDYPIYISGTASKSVASEMFSELNGISSFPTSIFFDKNGNVQKIHTGFYGPGTGKYYTNYLTETEAFLDDLISE